MADKNGNNSSRGNVDVNQSNSKGQTQISNSWANSINNMIDNTPKPSMRPITEGFSLHDGNDNNNN